MGKGDQRTKRGKRIRKTWGVSRPRTEKGRGAFTAKVVNEIVEVETPKPKAKRRKPKPAPKPAPVAEVVEEVVEAAPVVEETPPPVVEEVKEEVTVVEEAPVVEEKPAEEPKKEEPKAEEPKKEEKKAAKKPAAKKSDGKPDDLKKIEGIGPKIASTLVEGGVKTFAEMASSKPEHLAELIKDVRGVHVTDTWPEQAQLAADGKWDELKKLQDELDGGKKK